MTILELLNIANNNVVMSNAMSIHIAKLQLGDAITLLNKGYDLVDDVDEILKEYGTAEEAPDRL